MNKSDIINIDINEFKKAVKPNDIKSHNNNNNNNSNDEDNYEGVIW